MLTHKVYWSMDITTFSIFSKATPSQLAAAKKKRAERPVATPARVTAPHVGGSGNPAESKRLKQKQPDPDKDRAIAELTKAREIGLDAHLFCFYWTGHGPAH